MAHCFVKQVLLFFLVGAQKTGLLDIKNVMFLIVDNYAINRTNLDDWFRIWPWDKTSFTEGKGMEPNTCLTSHHRSDWEGTLKETCIYNGANIFFWDVSDEVKAVLMEAKPYFTDFMILDRGGFWRAHWSKWISEAGRECESVFPGGQGWGRVGFSC